MLEATPGKPWGIGFKDLLDVEPNMKWRYVVNPVTRCVPAHATLQTEDRQRAHGGD
jgi:hypothetical protein